MIKLIAAAAEQEGLGNLSIFLALTKEVKNGFCRHRPQQNSHYINGRHQAFAGVPT
jgi:hypothetical protein